MSHNNMIALKPVLLAWLEEAEAARRDPEGANGLLPSGEKKRDGSTLNCLVFNISYFLSKTNIALSPPDKNPYNAMVDRLNRKRTSIAAPEKRSLEAYFAVQPRPSGEKIAAIAEKLDLKKNVVRVWFCNQRQKQKRMKFAAQGGIH